MDGFRVPAGCVIFTPRGNLDDWIGTFAWRLNAVHRRFCIGCRPPGRRCKKIRPRKKLLLENWTPARLRHDCAGVKIARLAPEMKAPALARAGRAGKIFSAGSTVAAVKCV